MYKMYELEAHYCSTTIILKKENLPLMPFVLVTYSNEIANQPRDNLNNSTEQQKDKIICFIISIDGPLNSYM